MAVVLWVALLCEAGAAASPLHEIAPTMANANVCGNVVVHANAAIADLLRSDATLVRVRGLLRTANFEPASSSHRALLADIAHGARDITADVEHGQAESKRLREYAEHPAGTDRGDDVTALTDALDSALTAQHKMAENLASFLAALEAYDLRASARPAIDVRGSNAGDGDTFHDTGRPASALGAQSQATAPPANGETDLARIRGNELEGPLGIVGAAETRAASHADRAVGGC